MVVETLIRQLLEAGVHFGHQTKRWNPKMKHFIFGERSGIYIIDLEQTAERLKAACEFLKELAARGQQILFVGTKKQAQESVASCAKNCGMFYVNERWLGGTLTNFATIRKSVERLHEQQALRASEGSAALTKKEKALLDKDIGRLDKKLSGIAQMENLPSALVIVDPKKEHIAVREAKRLSIPIVALLDTNCDPEDIDYPIPGNDDALKSVQFVISVIKDNISDGSQKYLEIKKVQKEQQDSKEQTKSAEAQAQQPQIKEEEPKPESKKASSETTKGREAKKTKPKAKKK